MQETVANQNEKITDYESAVSEQKREKVISEKKFRKKIRILTQARDAGITRITMQSNDIMMVSRSNCSLKLLLTSWFP